VTEPALTLRAVSDASDASAIESLYTDSTGPRLSFLTGLLAQPTCHAWSYWYEDMVVGAVWCQCVKGVAEVLDLRVLASCRRRGYGRQLLEASLQALAPVRRVDLEVRASNEAALGLYRDLGFRETGRRPQYYGTPGGREDAILMTWTPEPA
jgi:ribosomal protein S18 acetylase RimI-like enzyme